MDKKLSGLLGMAMRARKLSSGDSIWNDIRNRKAKLVIVAADASENTRKKFSDKCNYYNIDYDYVDCGLELSIAIGKANCVAVAILDDGFARSMKTYLKG